MARYRAVYAYAWDLLDHGVAAVANTLRQSGATAVALAASYHAGKFLRPQSSGGRVYFPEDGTVYFHADPSRYGAIKPKVASCVADADPFAALPEAAPDLALYAWTVCLHNTRLGYAHPDCVVRNAYGDPYVYGLSPAHPDARAYVVNLCADVASRPQVRGLALETPGWLGYAHGYHHEFALLKLNPWAEALLALDFSDAALADAKRAGVDGAAARDAVRRALDWFFAHAPQPDDARALNWLLGDLIESEALCAFVRRRRDAVTSLVREVKAALPEGVELTVIPTTKRPTAASWIEGSDLAALAKVCDALEVPAYEATPQAAVEDVADVRRRAGQDARIRVILRPSHPDLDDPAAVAAAVRGLRAHGLDGLAFYNFGHVPKRALAGVAAGFAQLDREG